MSILQFPERAEVPKTGACSPSIGDRQAAQPEVQEVLDYFLQEAGKERLRITSVSACRSRPEGKTNRRRKHISMSSKAFLSYGLKAGISWPSRKSGEHRSEANAK